MLRKLKILGMGCLAVLVVLMTLGSAAKPLSYIPLKANFDYSLLYQVLNDKEVAGDYSYLDSGVAQGNPWIWFDKGDGHFTMAMHRDNLSSGRYVKVILAIPPIEPAPYYPPGSFCYPNNLPDVNSIKYNFIKTWNEFSDIDGDGLLEDTGDMLNLKDMALGQTKYCEMQCRFEVFTDSYTYDWGVRQAGVVQNVVQVTVERGLDGKNVWVITPRPDYKNRKLWRFVPKKGLCDQGMFQADFVLRIALK
jgi:hypothetical protein